MNDDPASLDLLHDIIVPAPVAWWPPAPGWYFVLAVLLGLALGFALCSLRRYLRNAYRREALAAIRRARPSAFELATLLKRAAITAYPREEVAGLTGQAWVDWLARTADVRVPPAVNDMLTAGIYRDVAGGDTKALARVAEQWIRRHATREPRPPSC